METNNKDLGIAGLFDVKGNVALVIRSGIGLMAVQALTVNGARVYVVGRTEDKLQRAADVHGKGIAGETIPLTADITSKRDIENLVKEIESRENSLCILINNAGINTSTHKPEGEAGHDFKKNLFKPESANFEDWAQTYKTNVSQLYFMTTAFLPLLETATEQQQGFSACVINITSILRGAANWLTKILASEVANHGTKARITAIAPGIFPNEMTAGTSNENQKSETPAKKYGHLPARWPGNDRDIANAILFAATNQYPNGQMVAVDGGYLLKHGQ